MKFVNLMALVFVFLSSTLQAAPAVLVPHSKYLGYSVRTLSGKEIESQNGGRAMPPASVAKMVSMACALKTLGPDFQFETEFGMTGKLNAGVLSGDLVVRGSGDPSFVTEELTQVIAYLRFVQGVREIKGNLVFDLSYMGTEKISLADGFAGDEGRSFAEDLPPIPFNFSSFGIWISPMGAGARPSINIIPPESLDLKIVNEAQVVGSNVQNLSIDFRPAAKTLVVRGTIGRDAEPKAYYRGISDFYDYLSRVFTQLWRESGGVWVKPQYVLQKARVASEPLWRHRSKPVSRMILDINKLSTNFGAELVALAAAGKGQGLPVSLQKSQKQIDSCVRNWGIADGDMHLANASGLSRESSIKPSALTNLLVKLHDEDFFPEYLSSLSVLGRDGTTRSRLKSLEGRARLKTGSIKGVRTIAGYVHPHQGEVLAMALFFDQAPLSDDQIQEIQNRVIQDLVNAKVRP